VSGRRVTALVALIAILLITAAWWALALWPLPQDAPEALLRARAACFGARADGLPHAGGWVLLIGEPLGMLGLLVAIWGDALSGGLRELSSSLLGRTAIGAGIVGLAVGVGAAVVRVGQVRRDSYLTEGRPQPPGAYPRLDRSAPPLRLVDQAGDSIGLSQLRGRPVLLTFAYAHCQTACPIAVHQVLGVLQRRPADSARAVIVTLDPWRDTPTRLPSIAEAWQLPPRAHVLSGSVASVEATLDAWGIARARDEHNGEIAHPTTVYLIDREGRIAYQVSGLGSETMAGLLDRLRT